MFFSSLLSLPLFTRLPAPANATTPRSGLLLTPHEEKQEHRKHLRSVFFLPFFSSFSSTSNCCCFSISLFFLSLLSFSLPHPQNHLPTNKKQKKSLTESQEEDGARHHGGGSVDGKKKKGGEVFFFKGREKEKESVRENEKKKEKNLTFLLCFVVRRRRSRSLSSSSSVPRQSPRPKLSLSDWWPLRPQQPTWSLLARSRPCFPAADAFLFRPFSLFRRSFFLHQWPLSRTLRLKPRRSPPRIGKRQA